MDSVIRSMVGGEVVADELAVAFDAFFVSVRR